MNLINKPLAFILRFFADLFGGSFAASILLFTVVINVVLIPLSIKSQKSAVGQTRIKPKLDELKKKYGDDRQKLATAQQKLYQDEGISMSGGCLPTIIRLVLMMWIYSLILSPLTYMANADNVKVKNVSKTFSTAMTSLKKSDEDQYDKIKEKLSWDEKRSANSELALIHLIDYDINHPEDKIFEEVLSKKQYKKVKNDIVYLERTHKDSGINYNLFKNEKLDLTLTPGFSINIFGDFKLIWLIPISAFLAQMLTSVVSMLINKKNNPDAPTMAGMLLTMPLISLFIGFSLPGGVGFYWICSSLVGGLIQSCMQLFYGPHQMLARERRKDLLERYNFEKKQYDKFNSSAEE